MSEKNVLTLHDITLNRTHTEGDNAGVIYQSAGDITINVEGNNNITAIDSATQRYCIYAGTVTFKGSGTLEVNSDSGAMSGNTYGIGSWKNITFNGPTVNISGTNLGYGLHTANNGGDIWFNKGAVTITRSYRSAIYTSKIYINGGTVTVKDGGTAFYKSPSIDDTMVVKGSTSADGTDAEDYVADNNSTYKYISAEHRPITNLVVKTQPKKIKYNVGETFEPNGLKVTATYDNKDKDVSRDITYAGNEDEFTFSPSLDTPLTNADTKVTVSYGGADVDIPITVKEQQGIYYRQENIYKTYGDAKFTNPLTQITVDGAISYVSTDTNVATVDAMTGEVTIVGVSWLDIPTCIIATVAETDTHYGNEAIYGIIVAKKEIVAKPDSFTIKSNEAFPTLTWEIETGTGETLTATNNDSVAMEIQENGTKLDKVKEGTFDIVFTTEPIFDNQNYNVTKAKGQLTVNKYTSSSSSSSSSNTITTSSNDTSNGSVTVSKATTGETATITVSPKDGYGVDSITVKDTNGNLIKCTKVNNTTYTFIKPVGQVKVDVQFEKISASVTDNRFNDVSENDWYYEGVAYCYKNGLMSGTGENTFAPTTRGMLMTVLARMADADTNGGEEWYTKGMQWAKANGISDGTNPEANLTREQMVTMLYRYAQKKGNDFADDWMFLLDFSDAEQISDYANEAMHWMVQNNIINGSDGKLNPKGTATRAEFAVIMQRYMNMK